MGYEFFCGIPVAVGAVLALVLGLFMMLDRAADALRGTAIEEPVSYIVADEETVWEASKNDKQALVKLAK